VAGHGRGGSKAAAAQLLERFAVIADPREPAKVRYPLPEVLLLVVSATIAGCDDYDEIAAWGESHLAFLRRFAEFHFGVPCRGALRGLAAGGDEPDRSGAVSGLLYRLGAGSAAGRSRSHRGRRQDLAPHA
jgi:hypothetical protein